MKKVRSIPGMKQAKGLLVALMLIIVAVAIGLYMGRWMVSPDWQAAVRFVVVGGLVLLILMNPVDGLAAWLMLAPFGEASYTEIWRILNIRMPPGIPDLTPDRLAVALLSVLYVARLAIGKKKLQRLDAEVFMAIFCIMLLPAAGAGLGGIITTAQLVLDKFLLPFLLFVLAKNLYEGEQGQRKLSATLAVIGIYISFMVFYEHWTGQPLFVGIGRTTVYSKSLRKIISLLGNPAFLGTVLGMIVPIALYRLMRERAPRAKAFYGGALATALLGNFLCYNRGAWLALAAALVVLLLERRYRQVLIPIILIGLVVGSVYWEMISGSAVVTERLSNVSSVRFRLDLLETSQLIIRDNWLFGVGVGNFSYYFLEYGGHWETLAYDLPTPHNTFILVLSTMGLISFVPYLLIFMTISWRMLKALWRSRWDKRIDSPLLVAGLAVVAVYVVSAAAVDLYISVFTSLVFFFITGTMMGYISRLPPHKSQPSTSAKVHLGSSTGRDLPNRALPRQRDSETRPAKELARLCRS